MDYEGELALVIGRRIKAWPEERWLEALAGVCCANDVTARDLQKKDKQFARSKSFDTFCPVGPAIVPGRRSVGPRDRDARQRRRPAVVADVRDGLLAGVSRGVRLADDDARCRAT